MYGVPGTWRPRNLASPEPEQNYVWRPRNQRGAGSGDTRIGGHHTDFMEIGGHHTDFMEQNYVWRPRNPEF